MTEKMTLVAVPGEPTLTLSRAFKAPRELVFAAWTEPEHVKRWFGPRVFTLPLCEIDLRPGGAFRYVMRGPAGTEFAGDYGMSGEYREVVPPERIVYTQWLEGQEDRAATVTLTFEERGGQTILTRHSVFKSVADRDARLAMGMEAGMSETLDRLAEHLGVMAAASVPR